MILRVIFVLSAAISLSEAADVNVNDFLTRYGYLDEDATRRGGGAAQLIDCSAALAEFQRQYGLTDTGRLDDATIRIMKMPRCGVADKGRRSKRSVATMWAKEKLTYFISSTPYYLDRRLVEVIVWNSLAQWQNISRLNFAPARSEREADIVIGFPHPQVHSNCSSTFSPVDLAHAFYPSVGRVHFNMNFDWRDRTRLESVALHEFGHSIGLTHSPDPRSIMYAMNTPTPKQITTTEINELRESYGAKEGVHWVEEDHVIRETEQERSSPPDPCADLRIDAAMRRRGDYVFFRGGWLWRFTRDTARVQGPYRISHFYKGVDRVEAAIEIEDEVFLFSGSELFIEKHNRTRDGRIFGSPIMYPPISISRMGIRNADRITTAFVWHGVNFEGKPGYYLVDDKEEMFYRFDPTKLKVMPNYPKRLKHQWPDVPPDAEAAFEYGEKNDLIFVKDGMAYMVNMTSSGSTRLAEGYPRPLASLFRYCDGRTPPAREHNHEHHHKHHHHHNHHRREKEGGMTPDSQERMHLRAKRLNFSSSTISWVSFTTSLIYFLLI